MKSRVTDEAAFILRRRDWQNTSLMLDLFTQNYGCIRVLAKGARRSPSKTPHQPFALLNVSWSGTQGLKNLLAIDGQALPVNERNYLALLYINELISAMLPEQEANPRIFANYLNLLQAASLGVNEAMLRSFELELMKLLGYFPDLAVDANSGSALKANNSYQFVINSGFIVCSETDSNAVRGQVVIDWLSGKYELPPVLRLAKSVLRSTIDYNLQGKKLKSREVYLEMQNLKR